MFETIRATTRLYALHGGRVLGASTAFYGMLATAPLLLMVIVVTGALTDEVDARREVIRALSLWVGDDGGRLIGEVLDNLSRSEGGPVAGAVGIALLFWAGIRLFSQLRDSLNHLWGVREGLVTGLGARARHQARKRLLALLMVAVVVAIIVTMIVTKVVLASAVRRLHLGFPVVWHLADLVGSFVVLTVSFAAVFKVLPAVKLSGRDILVGAVVTAALFGVGAAVLSYYLAFGTTASMYGAAGSLVALLVWVNYSAQVFFLGAAFTRVHAERHGRGVALRRGAVHLVAAEEPAPSSEDGDEEE